MPRIKKTHALRILADMPEPFSLDDYLAKLRAVEELMRHVRQAVTKPRAFDEKVENPSIPGLDGVVCP